MPDAQTENAVIEIEGFNGDWVRVNGVDAGAEGVWLAPEDDGTEFGEFYEPPIKVLWQSTTFQIGATYAGVREEMFAFTLAFHVTETLQNIWRWNESRFRKMFSPTKQSNIWVETEDSRRYLAVQLNGKIKVRVGQDPNGQQYSLVLVPLAGAYPRWLEPDYTVPYIATTDTTGGGTETGSLPVWNPTDTEVWLKYMAQGQAGIRWTIPDFSFGDDRESRAVVDAARAIVMPALIAGENIRVDTDPQANSGQVVSSLDTAVYLRMNGVQFLYPLPAYTGTADTPVLLPVSVTGAPIGAGIQLRCPRPWTRMWGLE